MSIATIEVQPRLKAVTFAEDFFSVSMADGRTIQVPLSWYPRLLHASDQERQQWRVFEDSDGRDIIHWDDLDEFIPVIALVLGVPSRESQRSFEKWLSSREQAGKKG